jgi:hypothetical protein
MFGGDNNLSSFVHEDMQEIAAGLKEGMAAIVLADFVDKPAVVAEITPGRGIEVLEQWGEIDTGDPVVLRKFLARALMSYPSARKAIGFWDHGTGVFDETDAHEKILSRSVQAVSRGERSRSFPARRLFFSRATLASDIRTRAMLHDDTNGGVLTNLEAAAMLASAFRAAGQEGQKVELLFSDTCLNGMIEVMEELGPFARTFVASPELEPGDGWDYHAWLSRVSAEPTRAPEDWSRAAVDAFADGYKPRQNMYPCTLGAFKTDNGIANAFKGLIDATRANSPHEVFFFLDHARAQTQSFAKRDTYDLKDFALRVVDVCRPIKPAVADAAQVLCDAFDAARVNNCCLGDLVAQSNGLAFWFPSSRSTLRRDIGTYERLTFSKKTGWSDFLKEFR